MNPPPSSSSTPATGSVFLHFGDRIHPRPHGHPLLERTASYAKDHDAGGAASRGAIYLVFCPRTPSFSVASLSIRGLDTLTMPPQVDAVVRAYNNTNKKTGIDYRGGREVTVSYSDKQLATSLCPVFHQALRNVTVFSTAFRQREKVERSGGHLKEEGDEEWRVSDSSARVEHM